MRQWIPVILNLCINRAEDVVLLLDPLVAAIVIIGNMQDKWMHRFMVHQQFMELIIAARSILANAITTANFVM